MSEDLPRCGANASDVPMRNGEVVGLLRTYIEGGGYDPGDRIPAERDLMVELGLTRNALRRALDSLEREGLIWRHVGKGTFVARGEGVIAPGAPAELSRQITPLRMMRARLCFEPAIAREAAVNASGEAHARMIKLLTRTNAAQNWSDYEAQDDRLHRSIAEASDNPLLLAMFDQLNQVRRAVAWDAVTRQSSRPPSSHPSFAEHDAIVQAIERRNPDAAHAAMRGHLRSVAARLFGDP